MASGGRKPPDVCRTRHGQEIRGLTPPARHMINGSTAMRLTLRTLLAYLDDTLEPAQAKIIGQKVAESDQARELMDHIKQVTRRRRITAPPASGPGSKIDPNTIAEYLDGAVSAEQASEVEQVCLGSDVHLAEIAA